MRKYGSYPLPDKQSAFVMMIMIWVAFTFLTESLFAMGTKSFLSLSIHLFSNLSHFYFLTESPFQWVKIFSIIIDPFSSYLSHFHFFLQWVKINSVIIDSFGPPIWVTFTFSIGKKSFLSLSIHFPPIWVTFRSVPLPAKCVLSFENCRELKTFSIFARKPFNKFPHHPARSPPTQSCSKLNRFGNISVRLNFDDRLVTLGCKMF